MAAYMQKGERITIADAGKIPPLLKITIGWLGGADVDMDASVFMLDENGKAPTKDHLVFYNNTHSPDGAVQHLGSMENGQTVSIDLSLVDSRIRQMVFVLSVYEAEERHHSFAFVDKPFIGICFPDGQEKARLAIDDLGCVTAVELGRLYIADGQWHFHAVGQGHYCGLSGFIGLYFEHFGIIEEAHYSWEAEMAADVFARMADGVDKIAENRLICREVGREELTDHVRCALFQLWSWQPVKPFHVGYYKRLFGRPVSIGRLQQMIDAGEAFKCPYHSKCPEYLKIAGKIDVQYDTDYAYGFVQLLRSIGLLAIGGDLAAGKREFDFLDRHIAFLTSEVDSFGINPPRDMAIKRELNELERMLKAERNLGKSGSGNAKKLPQALGLKKTISMGNLGKLLAELDGLVGLHAVKDGIISLTNLIRVNKMRKKQGLPVSELSLHLVFTGNPGTGKTTVARLLSRIFYALGLLSKGHLIEVDRTGLVAGYVGQTSLKTQEVIESAVGGVLFIDEAYSLTVSRGETDFGREAVDTLLKMMEDYRNDLIIIVAGHTEPMHSFLSSNPGFKSRFTRYIQFEDYTPGELVSIFEVFSKKAGYRLSAQGLDKLQHICLQLHHCRNKHFGNARAIRNIFEHTIQNQANRIVEIPNLSQDELVLIEAIDIQLEAALQLGR